MPVSCVNYSGKFSTLSTANFPIAQNALVGENVLMIDRTFASRLAAIFEQDPSLTEAGLAKAAGLDKTTVRKILKGEAANPRFDTALKICNALGLTVEEFMGADRSPIQKRILDELSDLDESRLQRLLGYIEALSPDHQ